MELPNITLSETDAEKLRQWAEMYQKAVIDAIKPSKDEHGLRRLPRDPSNPNKFLSVFKTEGHTYTIVGDNGIGFERYTVFQKLSIKRGFGRDFQQIYDALNHIKMGIAGETTVAKLRSEAIVAITGLQDSISSLANEQYEAALWLCTLFVLREDEPIATYSEQVAEEKIRDWANNGFSELDFFFLSGNMVPGYGKAFKEAIAQNEKARERLLDAIATSGS